MLIVVPVLLIVDGNPIPIGRGWGFVIIQRRGLAVQRNRLKQKVIGRGPLHLDDQVVPGVVHGITWNASRMPLLSLIVPNVPLISSDNAAFVSPDERLAINELIDIESQRL